MWNSVVSKSGFALSLSFNNFLPNQARHLILSLVFILGTVYDLVQMYVPGVSASEDISSQSRSIGQFSKLIESKNRKSKVVENFFLIIFCFYSNLKKCNSEKL